jgi:hypothetical protein
LNLAGCHNLHGKGGLHRSQRGVEGHTIDALGIEQRNPEHASLMVSLMVSLRTRRTGTLRLDAAR